MEIRSFKENVGSLLFFYLVTEDCTTTYGLMIQDICDEKAVLVAGRNPHSRHWI